MHCQTYLFTHLCIHNSPVYHLPIFLQLCFVLKSRISYTCTPTWPIKLIQTMMFKTGKRSAPPARLSLLWYLKRIKAISYSLPALINTSNVSISLMTDRQVCRLIYLLLLFAFLAVTSHDSLCVNCGSRQVYYSRHTTGLWFKPANVAGCLPHHFMTHSTGLHLYTPMASGATDQRHFDMSTAGAKGQTSDLWVTCYTSCATASIRHYLILKTRESFQPSSHWGPGSTRILSECWEMWCFCIMQPNKNIQVEVKKKKKRDQVQNHEGHPGVEDEEDSKWSAG